MVNALVKTDNFFSAWQSDPTSASGKKGKLENNPSNQNPVYNSYAFADSTKYANTASGNSLSFLAFLGTNIINKKEATFGPGISERTKKAINTIDGVCWAGKAASNGNRETAVIFPKGVDLGKPVELVYFFHGDGGNIHDTIMPVKLPYFVDGKHGYKDAMEKMGKERNAVFILSESKSRWRDIKMDSFQNEMTEKLLSINPETKIGSVTVKGFSGGGSPIYKAITEETIKADRIDLLDASYVWGNKSYKPFLDKNPNLKLNIYHLKNGKTEQGANAIIAENNGNPNIKVTPTNRTGKDSIDHYGVANTFFAE
jgi:hypothetical protein